MVVNLDFNKHIKSPTNFESKSLLSVINMLIMIGMTH